MPICNFFNGIDGSFSKRVVDAIPVTEAIEVLVHGKNGIYFRHVCLTIK
jgi:hypothetical protein